MAGLNLLSDKQIAKAKEGYTADGGNLYVRRRGDSRTFVFRYKVRQNATWAAGKKAGDPVELSLGSYPDRSLKDAREKAAQLRAEIAANRDPALVLRPVEAPKAKTFKEYAAELIESKKTGWRNGKHHAQWPSTLSAYAYPHVGAKAPGEVTVSDVQAILTPLWATKTETATRVRQRIEAVLDYAFVVEGIDRRNPARWKGNLDRVFPAPRKVAGKVKHHAAPPYAKVPAIMKALRVKDSTSSMALRFSVLTAARSMEVRGAEWAEFDLEGALWHVPEGRMKGGDAHTVPLNAEALAILAQMADRRHPDSERVFPGPRGGLLSDVAINKTLHGIMAGITAHGLARSCFRDWGAEQTAFPSAILEAALAHKNDNAVEAAYLRTKFLEKRMALMREWGSFVGEHERQG